MNSLIEYFDSFNLDLPAILKTGGILLSGILAFSLCGRFVFGRKSVMNAAVSSSIAVLFIYAITAVLCSIGGELTVFATPLPFVDMSANHLNLFSFKGADYTIIASQLTSMIMLSFLINLADSWFPCGQHLFSWLFFRCMTVAIGFVMHFIVVLLFSRYLPEGIMTYAPAILLALLIIMMLTGALKLLVGLVLTTINPLIAALYTFFFASFIGKQISKAVLTTALLSGFLLILEYLGFCSFGIAAVGLVAYVPFILILIALWYLVHHKL